MKRGRLPPETVVLLLGQAARALDAAHRRGLVHRDVKPVDYVAPEQIRGLSVLGLADQYSLGCVLYECLTGRVPFEKDMNEAIMWAHMEDHPTRPTLLRPDLPREIDEVFTRVLAKQALAAVNVTVWTTGYLPPSSCTFLTGSPWGPWTRHPASSPRAR